MDYLDKFRKEVDACESQQGHAVPGIPPFPARTTISPSDLTLPRTIPPHQPTLAVAGLDYRNILGPTIFLNELAAYREALLKQCNATPDLARIASTQALFEKNLDRAAFGHCRANAARGPNSGNNPTLPSFSSAEAQCHIAAIDHLKSLTVDDCTHNPRAAGKKEKSDAKIKSDDDAIKKADSRDKIPTSWYNDPANKKPDKTTIQFLKTLRPPAYSFRIAASPRVLHHAWLTCPISTR